MERTKAREEKDLLTNSGGKKTFSGGEETKDKAAEEKQVAIGC